MKESMAKAGYAQGEMAPKVESYQKPESEFSQAGFNKTTAYVERQNAFQGKESKELKSQAYKGRYS
jgi:hypothetical protein